MLRTWGRKYPCTADESINWLNHLKNNQTIPSTLKMLYPLTTNTTSKKVSQTKKYELT